MILVEIFNYICYYKSPIVLLSKKHCSKIKCFYDFEIDEQHREIC